MTTTTITPTVRQTAKAIRGALAVTFPGARLSVQMDRGSAYGWIDIAWTDGPSVAQVREVADGYCSQRWDTLTECYRPTGVVGYACRGIACHRSYSERAMEWARAQVSYDHQAGQWQAPGVDYLPGDDRDDMARKVLAGQAI